MYFDICHSFGREQLKEEHETELLFIGIESMYLMGKYNSNKNEWDILSKRKQKKVFNNNKKNTLCVNHLHVKSKLKPSCL